MEELRWGLLDVNYWVVQGYVWCSELRDGELHHDCVRNTRPHRVPVCIYRARNRYVWPLVLHAVGPRPERRPFIARVVRDGATLWAGRVVSARAARGNAETVLGLKRLPRRSRVQFSEWLD